MQRLREVNFNGLNGPLSFGATHEPETVWEILNLQISPSVGPQWVSVSRWTPGTNDLIDVPNTQPIFLGGVKEVPLSMRVDLAPHFRVLVRMLEPFVFTSDDPNAVGDDRFARGFLIELLKSLSLSAGFTYELIPDKDVSHHFPITVWFVTGNTSNAILTVDSQPIKSLSLSLARALSLLVVCNSCLLRR
jgi:hypothetical protein